MSQKNKFVYAFEQFGRSFLLPVSVLPGVGIIKGIGTAFSNSDTLKMFPVLQNQIFQFIMSLQPPTYHLRCRRCRWFSQTRKRFCCPIWGTRFYRLTLRPQLPPSPKP